MTVKGRTIKAFSSCIIVLLMSLVFMSCASAEYEHMSSGDGESAIIIRGETVYEFYGFVSNRKLTGP